MIGPVRILHVDDNAEFAAMAAEFLEREDDRLSVVTESTVDAGLERVAAESFDCVVSDYEMPATDGLRFLDAVRERHPDLPFILFTGRGSEEIASEAISAGVTDYLQKGAGSDQYAVLANRIRNAVAQHRAEQTASQVRELADHAADVLWMFSADWSELLFINDAYEEIWGRSTAALERSPRDFLDGIHPQDRDRVQEAMARISEGETVDIEYRVNEAADWRWVWVQGAPITDETGAVVRVTGFARDVTERRHRERVLKELQAIAAEITGYDSADAVCRRTVAAAETVLDFDMCVINLEADGVLEVAATSAEVPADGTTAMSIDEGLAGKTYRTGEAYLVDDIAAYPAADPQGPYESAISVPIGEYGVFQAVAEAPGAFDERDRELAELLLAHTARALERLSYTRELKRERDRFGAIFEAMPDPIVHTEYEDGVPVIRTTNTAFAETFGVDPATVEGRPVSEVVVTPARREEAEALDAELRSGGHVEREIDRRVDGEIRTFRFRGTVLDLPDDDADRRIDGDAEGREVIGVYTDVTEQRDRERRLERQNERLERFAGVLSHDLRNPLNVAQGRLELARQTAAADVDEHLAEVTRAHDRMSAMIKEVLAMAREGKPVTETEPVAVATLAQECWEMVATTDATLSVASGLTLRADRGRLRQLLENLFRNAVEHGGERVTVTVGDLDGQRGFYVADDGPGIPPDERERVFESGYTTSDDGTGFGLAIVREIAEAHGWTIDIVDGEHGGIRFEIRGVDRVADTDADVEANADD